MKIEKVRKIYITQEEEEMFNKVATLIEYIYDDMDDENELIFTDENDTIHALSIHEVKDFSWLLSNIAKSKIEIA